MTSADAAGDCGLPLTPFYRTAAEYYLGGKRRKCERENRIIRIYTRLVDKGSAKRA